ncbi:MAG: hypothetical protein ACRDT0_27530 [Pseudonocardiaceae bacterium]
MTYFIGSTMQVAAWVALGANTEITYRVLAEADTVEFSLGSRNELELQTSEAGLQRCVTEFTAALDELHSRTRDSGSEA